MLREVHGHPQLHLSKVEDAGSMRGHHHRYLLQRTYKCEVKCCEHAVTIVTSKELAAIREEVVEEAPNPKWWARSFKHLEGAKEVL